MAHETRISNALRISRLGWTLASGKLHMFVEEMEDSLGQRLSNLKSRHAPKLAELANATGGVPVSWDELDDLLKIDGLPTLMRNALFLILFGVFEHHVAGVCDRIREASPGIAVKPPNMHLPASKKYLRDEAQLGGGAFGLAWEFVDGARHVRNYVAHEAAAILDSDDSSKARKAREFIGQATGVALNDGQIELDAAFLPALLDRMDQVFETFEASVGPCPPNAGA